MGKASNYDHIERYPVDSSPQFFKAQRADIKDYKDIITNKENDLKRYLKSLTSMNTEKKKPFKFYYKRGARKIKQ